MPFREYGLLDQAQSGTYKQNISHEILRLWKQKGDDMSGRDLVAIARKNNVQPSEVIKELSNLAPRIDMGI